MVTRMLVQSAIHTAATALAQLPPEEWAGWIAYLCEMLEEQSHCAEKTCDIAKVLTHVQMLLQERIERGSW